MKKEEIIEVLKTKMSISEFAYHDFEDIEELGESEEIDQYGGEGQGDTWYSIKHFPKHDIYLRIDGYYSSYHGTDFEGWDSVCEVKPKQKTITVFE